MTLAVVEADRFYQIEAIKRPREAHRGVLSARQKNQSCCVADHWVRHRRLPVLD
jgi:hypothetical protein